MLNLLNFQLEYIKGKMRSLNGEYLQFLDKMAVTRLQYLID